MAGILEKTRSDITENHTRKSTIRKNVGRCKLGHAENFYRLFSIE